MRSTDFRKEETQRRSNYEARRLEANVLVVDWFCLGTAFGLSVLFCLPKKEPKKGTENDDRRFRAAPIRLLYYCKLDSGSLMRYEIMTFFSRVLFSFRTFISIW